ncbi:MAG: glycerophosphodiester phosphodiesterase [Deltaproteobacteria bacterium]|nr:glycerophosphodiester phosphodiesterase [Deltaproteobacteria bacterium]
MTRYFTGPTPRLFAHRGASGEAPENTVAALQRAVALGLEYAEIDVQASQDGQIAVIHDETLERTTGGHGQVRDYSLTELRRLDAGYRFTRDDGQTFPFRATGVIIPTLAEVLTTFPSLKFTVEIKQADPPIEAEVIDIIRQCHRAEEVIVGSEHDPVMARVRALAPDIATSFSFGELLEFFQRLGNGDWSGYRPPGQALQIPPEYQGMALVTEESLKAAHGFSCEIHVWTINEPHEIERLLDLNVDGIMSDFPDRLCAAVARRRHS